MERNSRRRRSGRRTLGAALGALLAGAAAARAGDPPGSPSRYTPGELADALEPWSFETATGLVPPAPAPADSVPAIRETPAPEPGAPAPETSPEARAPEAAGGSERVLVVRCRQLLLDQPVLAARLAALLRAGAALEEARRALGGIDIVERTRVYAIDEFDSDIRAEIEALPPGGWSRPRPWRGRSLLYQVLEKEERARDALPKLGEGLDAEEQGRIARAQRAQPSRTAPVLPPEEQRDPAHRATVIEQQKPVYPAAATTSGEVTIVVEVGRLGEVVRARIERSTDPVFDTAAIEAAQRSTYRPAERNGVPEPGTITLTFRFVSPSERQD